MLHQTILFVVSIVRMFLTHFAKSHSTSNKTFLRTLCFFLWLRTNNIKSHCVDLDRHNGIILPKLNVIIFIWIYLVIIIICCFFLFRCSIKWRTRVTLWVAASFSRYLLYTALWRSVHSLLYCKQLMLSWWNSWNTRQNIPYSILNFDTKSNSNDECMVVSHSAA